MWQEGNHMDEKCCCEDCFWNCDAYCMLECECFGDDSTCCENFIDESEMMDRL